MINDAEHYFICLLILLVFFGFFRATAYGGSQARGPVRAIAASLCLNHSNVISKLHL